MRDAYGGVEIKQRPPKIRAVQFTGDNMTDIARWLELHATFCADVHIEQRPGYQPQLHVGDKVFGVNSWIVVTDDRISKFTPLEFERTFEIVS